MNSGGSRILLLLAAIGCGVWGVWEHRGRAALADELRVVKEERDRLRVTAEKKISLAATTELDRRGPRGLDPDADPAGDEEEETAPPKPDGPAMDFPEMMRDPKMREAMRTQMRAGMEFAYRDLFELLELNPEDEAKLKSLLADRMTAQMDAGLGMMDEGKGREAEQEMMEKLEAGRKESEEALRELLGPERYDQFERFEKSQPERQQLQTFRGLLAEGGLDLDVETESQLMDLMYEERTGFQWEKDFSDQQNFKPSDFNEASAERYLEQNRELQDRIRERASGVLTAPQLEAFQRAQEQQTAMAEMGLRMAARMFQGGGDPPAGPPAEAGK